MWGTVCDKNWSITNTQVVCKQLGYGYGFLSTDPNVPAGTGPILMENVKCRNSQTNLLACSHNGFGNHNCGHVEDVGVICWSHSHCKLLYIYMYISHGAKYISMYLYSSRYIHSKIQRICLTNVKPLSPPLLCVVVFLPFNVCNALLVVSASTSYSCRNGGFIYSRVHTHRHVHTHACTHTCMHACIDTQTHT